MNDRMNVTGGRTRRGLRRLALLFLAVMMTLSFAMTSAAAYDDINAPRNSAGPGTSGWVANADGTWSYYHRGDAIKGEWAEIGTHWYLFDAEGHMLTGWQTIGHDDYYLAQAGDATHPAGAMYVSERTPEGIEVDEKGIAVKLPAVGDRPNPYGVSCVEVSIAEQMVYCYLHNTLVWQSPCVTGRLGGRETTVGAHQILSKERDRYLQGTNEDGSKYKSFVHYWMPFHNGEGLHDASWRSSFGGTIYKNSGSHGCVNLPPANTGALYNIVWVGMPVFVH